MIHQTPSLTHKNRFRNRRQPRNAIVSCLLILIAVYSRDTPALQTPQGSNTPFVRTRDSLAAPNKWYTFKGPDHDFTLSFPGKPSLDDVSPGPFTDIREFRFTTTDGMSFSINFHDIGGDPRAAENNQWAGDLERVLSDADRKQGLRVLQMHRIAKNTVEFDLWQGVPETNSIINYLRRNIIRRARVYTLVCGWLINGREVDKPVCQRFFNSMHFINQAPRRAKRR